MTGTPPTQGVGTQLNRSPLAEALLEIRWRFGPPAPAGQAISVVDPGYALAVGRLYDRIRDRMSHLEELPVALASIPESMTPHVVRYRFRPAPNKWPCVQLGPGVATVNFENAYSWESFRELANWFVPHLEDAYQGVDGGLRPFSVILRYVNAVKFDYSANDLLPFLGQKVHVKLELPAGIRDSEYRKGPPSEVAIRLALPLSRPVGIGNLQIGSGTHQNSPAVVWDQSVVSAEPNAPTLLQLSASWLDQAHEVMEKWFFTLIDGELRREFSGAAAGV